MHPSRTVFLFNSRCREHYSVTWNVVLLLSVFLVPFTVVVTLTGPAVAPGGTLVSISDFDRTAKVAAVPLKVTLVAPFKSVPRILTAAPTLPEVGTVSTNGPRPTDRLKTSPQPKYLQLPLRAPEPPPKVAP